MKINLHILVLSVFILFSCNQESQQQASSVQNKSLKVGMKTYAVIIGVEDYQNFDFDTGDLNYTVDDAEMFARFLMSEKGGNVPKEQIYLLTDEKAKKANIIKYTKKMFSRASNNDQVIFYFSGHGDDGCFLPYDVTNFGGNLLYFSEVKQLFRVANCKNKLLFADACHAGSLKGNKSKAVQKKLKREKAISNKADYNIAVVLSSRADEQSLEDPANKQGVFSYYLIRGLAGSADKNKDQMITIKELFDYVSYQTPRRAKSIKYGHPQHPIAFGQFDLNMVVAKL